MNVEKFCVNCAHCTCAFPIDEESHEIRYFCNRFPDPVTGRGKECAPLRSLYGECGAYGKFFKGRGPRHE